MDELDGFSKVEYLATFEAILLGFVASQYFAGWGLIVRNRYNTTFSYKYLMFTFVSFTVLIIHWWNIWQSSVHNSNSLTNFLMTLPNSLIYYSLTTILFKDIKSNCTCDLEFIYMKYRKKVWFLFMSYFLYDQISTFNDHDANYRYLSILLCMSAILKKGSRFHNGLLSFCLVVVISYIYMYSDYKPEFLNNLDNPYSRVEHLTVFLSFLYGYIIAEFFQGWSCIYKNFRHKTFSLNHLLWTILAFFLLLDNWWGGWVHKYYISQGLLNFLVILISPFLFYVISVLLFPDNSKSTHFKEYFYSNKNYIFIVFGLFFLINICTSIIHRRADAEYQENLLRGLAILMSGVACQNNSVWLHRLLIGTSMFLLVLNQFYLAS